MSLPLLICRLSRRCRRRTPTVRAQPPRAGVGRSPNRPRQPTRLASSGGLKGVKALGVLAHGRAQLTMNVTDLQATPVSKVYAQVCRLAARHKAEPVEAEIIGLLPEVACEQDSEWMRLLNGFDPATKILERRLEDPLEWPED